MAVFARGREMPIYYFDSICLPVPPFILAFLNCFPKWLKNSRPYQSPLFDTCGHHCISFVYFLSLGYPFDAYLNLLERSHNPDLFVKKLVNKLVEGYQIELLQKKRGIYGD